MCALYNNCPYINHKSDKPSIIIIIIINHNNLTPSEMADRIARNSRGGGGGNIYAAPHHQHVRGSCSPVHGSCVAHAALS